MPFRLLIGCLFRYETDRFLAYIRHPSEERRMNGHAQPLCSLPKELSLRYALPRPYHRNGGSADMLG